MIKTISANKTDFAVPLNLQLFGEDEPVIEVITPAKDEVYTSAADHEKAKGVKEPVIATQEPTKDTEPVITKEEPTRDLEKDAAFAEMRRKAEDAETKAAQLEQQQQKTLEIARKYGHLGVFSDSEVAEKYGLTHGLFTLADVDRQMQEDERQSREEEYRKSGLDPEKIKGIVKNEVDNHPDMIAAREAKAIADKANHDIFLVSNFNSLQTEFPDLVKTAADVSREVWDRWDSGKTGLTLTDAYYLENRKTLAEKQQAATKQAALNALNSKNHMKTNEGSSEELQTGSVPDEVMAINRRMFARELKAGTMTEKDIVKHYLRHTKT